MPGFVHVHRPPDRTGDFELYVAVTETSPEAVTAIKERFGLGGWLEVNGRPLDDRTVAALGLAPGDVRAMGRSIAHADAATLH